MFSCESEIACALFITLIISSSMARSHQPHDCFQCAEKQLKTFAILIKHSTTHKFKHQLLFCHIMNLHKLLKQIFLFDFYKISITYNHPLDIRFFAH